MCSSPLRPTALWRPRQDSKTSSLEEYYTQDPVASPTERNTQKHRASAARGGSGVQPFLSGSGNAQRMTNCRGSVFMPSIKNQETCTECCISSLGGQCSGTALPGHSPAPWASDHPGDSPGASLVSELGLCGWLGSTPAWFADSEKRHREGHLVPQGRSVADCSRAPWQRPPEKGREWSKRRTGRLRARRAPPSLILAAHTLLHSDIQLQLPDRTSTCGTA